MKGSQQDAKRDLNPHKAAMMAMWIWSADYAARGLGSMGYWDSLTESERNTCRRAVKEILQAPDEPVGKVRRGGAR